MGGSVSTITQPISQGFNALGTAASWVPQAVGSVADTIGTGMSGTGIPGVKQIGQGMSWAGQGLQDIAHPMGDIAAAAGLAYGGGAALGAYGAGADASAAAGSQIPSMTPDALTASDAAATPYYTPGGMDAAQINAAGGGTSTGGFLSQYGAPLLGAALIGSNLYGASQANQLADQAQQAQLNAWRQTTPTSAATSAAQNQLMANLSQGLVSGNLQTEANMAGRNLSGPATAMALQRNQEAYLRALGSGTQGLQQWGATPQASIGISQPNYQSGGLNIANIGNMAGGIGGGILMSNYLKNWLS